MPQIWTFQINDVHFYSSGETSDISTVLHETKDGWNEDFWRCGFECVCVAWNVPFHVKLVFRILDSGIKSSVVALLCQLWHSSDYGSHSGDILSPTWAVLPNKSCRWQNSFRYQAFSILRWLRSLENSKKQLNINNSSSIAIVIIACIKTNKK